MPAPRATARGTEVQQAWCGVLGRVQADLRQGLSGHPRTALSTTHLLQLLPQVRARMRVTTTTADFLTASLSNKIRI